MRWFFLALGLEVICGLTLASCTASNQKDMSQSRDHLVVGIAASPATLDPRKASDAVSTRLAGLLYSSLLRIGPDLQFVGDAATKWTYKNKILQFDLRSDLVFTNGTPLQAQDLEYTFQEYQRPESAYHSPLKVIEKILVTKKPDGGLSLQLFLREDSATILSVLTSVKLLRATSSGLPLGSGPYELETETANEIRLRARSSTAQKNSLIPWLVFKIIRDDNTRYLKVLKGEVDIIQSDLPLTKIADLERQNHLTVLKYPGLSMTYILLNLQDAILKDHDVRQALALALNREEIIQHKLQGLARLATSILTPEHPYFNTALKPYTFQLPEAQKTILAKKLNGRSLSLKTSNSQAAIENGRVLSYQLAKLGLKIEQQSFEWGTYYGDIQKGRFQLATMKWVGSSDPDIYRQALHSREVPPGRNRGRYANANFDKVVDKAAQTLDEHLRKQLYQQAQKIVFEDLPYIPLWYEMEVAIAHKRVKGYKPPLNGDYSAFLGVTKE